jgi:hypothetical protein
MDFSESPDKMHTYAFCRGVIRFELPGAGSPSGILFTVFELFNAAGETDRNLSRHDSSRLPTRVTGATSVDATAIWLNES